MGCNTSQEQTQVAAAVDEVANGKKTEDSLEDNKDEDKKDEEQAALKIQAVFRGHQARKSMSMKGVGGGSQTKEEEGPTKAELEAEFRADDKDLCNAASKIQASFRGHQARKQIEAANKPEEQNAKDEEELDIDLTDPDLNKAATKIQASFRGHKVRKEN